MQLRISLDFKEEPRSEATGLPDAGSRPRDVCSPMSTGGLQWMQLDGFGGGVRRSHSGSSVGGVPCRPCDPIAGARRRPHRRSRGGPERQSQSARGGLLVMHTYFFHGGPGIHPSSGMESSKQAAGKGQETEGYPSWMETGEESRDGGLHPAAGDSQRTMEWAGLEVGQERESWQCHSSRSVNVEG